MEIFPTIPPECYEWRRFRALDLKRRGWCQRDIAEAFDVSEEAVRRWLARVRDRGPEALRARPAPGRSPRLNPDQVRAIPELLWHGPEAYGFRGQVWTCARIAKVLEWEFGVHYHKDHVGRILKGLGWTPQQPIKRAAQRDEEAIWRWRDEIWPGLRRVPAGSAEPWFLRTNRASTSCRGWSRPTPPKDSRRSSARSRRATTSPSWAG